MKKAIAILVLGLLICSNLNAKDIKKKYLDPDFVFKPDKLFPWYEDVGNWGRLIVKAMTHKSSHAIRIDEEIVRDGKYSIRFEMQDRDCGKGDCKRGSFEGAYGRSEIDMYDSIREGYKFDHGEVWYAWSMYIPKTTNHIRPAYTMVDQFKELSKMYKKRWKKYPECGHSDPSGGSDGIRLFFHLEEDGMDVNYEKCIKDKKGNPFSRHMEKIIIPSSELHDLWLDFLLHVNWSYEDDGFMHLWVNDKKVYQQKGTNSDIPVKVEGKLPGAAFRFGIYNGKIDKYEKKFGKKRPTQVVYYDALKRGFTCEETALWHDCNNLPIK